MTYAIEQLRTTFKGNGEYCKSWDPIDWFEDRDLARKELANLIKAWHSDFRLVEVEK